MLIETLLAKFRECGKPLGGHHVELARPRRSTRNHLGRLLVEFLEDRTCPSRLFAPALGSPFPAGDGPVSVVVADFDGDGDLDLATANASSDTVSVLVGDGSGGFSAEHASQIPVGQRPNCIAVGDFNGDGDPDLATGESDTVTVLIGDGAGGFPPERVSRIPAGGVIQSVAVGDLNGDGHLDLATASTSGFVGVLLGDGAGGFPATDRIDLPTGSFTFSVAMGDFNGDGNLDLVTANFGSDNVSVLLGDGAGSFPVEDITSFPVGEEPFSVAVGDFDGDGNLDLAATELFGLIWVLLGDGSGSFSTMDHQYVTGWYPRSITSGDFDGDGVLDLATANSGDGNVIVLLGDGLGGFPFEDRSHLEVGVAPYSVAVGDLDGDGDLDLAAANSFSDNVSVLLNTTIDITPPVLTVPMDVTLEAASDRPGVHYTFEVSAYDDSGEFTLTCTPESGSFIPLGMTTVTCVAVDPSGNESTGNFTVTVVDVTPPTLTAPADLTINAWEDTTPTHTGTATATDNAGDPVVTYTDSILIGPTGTEILRIWRAADASGNVSTAEQRITVITDPILLVPNLAGEVESLNLPDGLEQSLTAKLGAALESLQAGEIKEAGNILRAFIHQVEAQHGKQLTDAEADSLINAASRVLELLPAI